jgi:hypothetical protein
MPSQFATFDLDTYGVVTSADGSEGEASLVNANPNTQNQARCIGQADGSFGLRLLVRIVSSPQAGANVLVATTKSPFTQLMSMSALPADAYVISIDDQPVEFFIEAGQSLFAIGSVAGMVICVARSKWCPGAAQ